MKIVCNNIEFDCGSLVKECRQSPTALKGLMNCIRRGTKLMARDLTFGDQLPKGVELVLSYMEGTLFCEFNPKELEPLVPGRVEALMLRLSHYGPFGLHGEIVGGFKIKIDATPIPGRTIKYMSAEQAEASGKKILEQFAPVFKRLAENGD